MWIERLDVHGFRGLAGEFEFSPGLNLVVGDNEAGKSTLHEALIRSLFGFDASERRRYRGRSVRDDCQPWDGRPFGLVASVRDAAGRDYRIEWDFAVHSVRLLDGGADRSGEVRLRNDEVGLGEFLLDVGLDDFRQVCCIDQAALEAVRSSPTLGLALQEAVAQIGGDVAAHDVLARLDGFLRDSIGVRVDTLTPTARGRLSALLREREEVVERIGDERSARERIAQLASDLELNSVEDQSMAAAIETARQRLLLTEVEDLAGKVEEARRLTGLAGKRVDLPSAPAQHVIDAIRAAYVRLAQLADDVAALEVEVERTRAEVEALEERERGFDGPLAELASYAEVDVASREQVQQSCAELEALRATAVPAPGELPEPDPALERYRAERLALFALDAGAAPWTTRRVLWTALVVVSLGTALLVRALIRRVRGRQQEPSELERRLAQYGASSLAALDERVAEEDHRLAAAQARADVARTQAEERAQRLRGLERSLGGALDAADATAAATLEARASAYLTACEKQAQRVALELEQQRVHNELQQLRLPRQSRRDLVSERDELERQLRGRYAGLGIEADDLAAARDTLEALLGRVADVEATNRHADAAAQALTSVLGASTQQDLDVQAAEAERVHAEHVARYGTVATTTGDAARLKREVSELTEEATDTHDRVTELQTRIGDLEDALGSPAELEERLAELDAQIARLEQAKEAVRIARDVLRSAADDLNREFQPYLRETLQRNLPRITGGRYSDASVDGELQVQVVVPAVGRQVAAEQLSRATRDQIFLVQRLEIARLLAPAKGSAPLILDDPFAHYDAKRLRFGLELLREAASERQVVIFSEDANLSALAVHVCGEFHVIELPEPSASQAVT